VDSHRMKFYAIADVFVTGKRDGFLVFIVRVK
jgi:hypothetical protein